MSQLSRPFRRSRRRADAFRQAGMAVPPSPRGNGDLPAGWLAGCFGKQVFTTPALAILVVRRSGIPRSHYRCQWCGQWHLGGVRPRRPDPAREAGRFRSPGMARLLDLQAAAWEAPGW